MLTFYEDSLCSSKVEKSQLKDVESVISDSITDISELYKEFHQYFIEFVAKESD